LINDPRIVIQTSSFLQIGLIKVRSNEFEEYKSSFINEDSINEVEIKKSN
jgi:hypothetical protein